MDNDRSPSAVRTSALLRSLFKTSKLERFMEKQAPALQVQPFCEYISALCCDMGVLRADVIRRSGIERSYGFQIFQGTKKPSRDKVIQLAIGFGLDYDGAQELLKRAHHSALYPRFKRDAAIIYCLGKRLGFVEVQEVLSSIDVPGLGKEVNA